METIPLRPVFENELFQSASNPVQLAILKTIYQICIRRNFSLDYSQATKRYAETNDVLFYKNRKLIITILEQVMPKIYAIKALKRKQVVPGHISQSRIAIQSKLKSVENIQPFDESGSHAGIVPVNSPRIDLNAGKFDHVTRQNALSSNKKATDKMFTDD